MGRRNYVCRLGSLSGYIKNASGEPEKIPHSTDEVDPPFIYANRFPCHIHRFSAGHRFGPIKSWEALFYSTYGHLWLTAFFLGIFALLWGIFVGYRGMMRLFLDDFVWIEAVNGNKEPLMRGLFRLTVMESMEVIGFIALVVIMVLL